MNYSSFWKETIAYKDYIRKFTENRCLFSFYTKYLKGKFDYSYLKKISSGTTPPSISFIAYTSTLIHPSLWFYDDYRKIIDKEKITENEICYDYTKSINFQILKNIENSVEWCKDNNFNYITLWTILNNKRRLTISTIYRLKDVFPPSGWFKKSI